MSWTKLPIATYESKFSYLKILYAQPMAIPSEYLLISFKGFVFFVDIMFNIKKLLVGLLLVLK